MKDNFDENIDDDLVKAIVDSMVKEARAKNQNKEHVKKYHQARKLHQEIADRMSEYFRDYNEECNKILDDGFSQMQRDVCFNFDDKMQVHLLYDFLIYPHFNTCLCEVFLKKKKVRSEKNLSMIHAMLESQPALYQVKNLEPEEFTAELENLMTGKRITIVDERMSIMNKPETMGFFYLRIITWNGISFQTGMGFPFEKSDGEIRRWIKRNKNRNRVNEQILDLYEMYQRKQAQGTAVRAEMNYTK